MSRWREIWEKKNHSTSYRPRRRTKIKAKIAAKLALFAFFGLVALLVLGAASFAFYAKDLPRPDKIVRN